MNDFIKTEVSCGEGTIKFKHDILRSNKLAPFIERVSLRILGEAFQYAYRVRSVKPQSFICISATAMLVVIQVKFENRQDHIQVIFFQMNPLRQQLFWKHMMTFDGEGVKHLIGAKKGFEWEFVHFALFDEKEDPIQHVDFQVWWCINSKYEQHVPQKHVWIGRKGIRLAYAGGISWDGNTCIFFRAEII